MRRKDRAMDEKFAYGVIDKAKFGTLAIVDREGYPYAIPLSLVRDGKYLYFHGAKGGFKHELLDRALPCMVTFVGDNAVPNFLSDLEIENIVIKGPHHILGSKVFTTEFESALVKGICRRVEDDAEKIRGLKVLCEKYTPDKMKFFDCAVKSSLAVTEVYVIEILEITGKRKKFDKYGEELKFGRME